MAALATSWRAEVALEKIKSLARLPGALLPILHALQEEFGYIDEAAIPLIASELNLSKAEVHGVISFYHDFRREPAGRHVLKICRAEACQSMGCDKLTGTSDEALTIEPVYCLGLCALSPAVMLDGVPYARMTQAKLGALIENARRAQ